MIRAAFLVLLVAGCARQPMSAEKRSAVIECQRHAPPWLQPDCQTGGRL